MNPRQELVSFFEAALDRVHAGRALARALRESEVRLRDRDWTLIAAGKAAAPMAAAARDALGTRLRGGLVVTKDGHGAAFDGLDGFEVLEAGHPVPDARGLAAAERALDLARGLGADDALLVLLSGGASSLLPAPVEGVTLRDVQQLTASLLRAGVDIAALNAVRKHLSRIQGGRLALAAAPAAVETLVVSDVAGDRPDVIGSGPTVGDPSSFGDALEVLRGASLLESAPASIRDVLESGVAGLRDETPLPGDVGLVNGRFSVVASLADALDAARQAGERLGLRVRGLGRVLDADVDVCVIRLAEELERARVDGVDLIVAGGEPTVVVRGPGRGGRAQHLALALAQHARGKFAALVAGTDGTDGPTDAAGAVVDDTTLARGSRAGSSGADALAGYDSGAFLEGAGDLLRTGPTATNVNDLALIRVLRPPEA
ncbi:MAG: DUF4147 domain-containing protein [Deltaproteobacteria bacterium]|nr:DUF4147 domain-containing protein [Deltaproteobacteria bacterium]MBW2416224.1 DUF4147 domain-containing protein [Deltaproteobacteria bacterium]